MYISPWQPTVLTLFFSLLLTSACISQTTDRVSLDSSGIQGNNQSSNPALSADGRYVASQSDASNLVPGDLNGLYDIFVRDRDTGVTERVTVKSLGVEGEWGGGFPSISADGRYVAYQSASRNLVSGDTNSRTDVFVHDRHTGVTELVSVNTLGNQGNGWSSAPKISADGRFVAFLSVASNLVSNDTNGFTDVFVHDCTTGETERVSVGVLGRQGNYPCDLHISFSADGRYVAFSSWADNLVPGDTNGHHDIFVHDRHSGVTERVSKNSLGGEAGMKSSSPVLSGGGGHVAFQSFANNLVHGDTNAHEDIFVHDRWNGLGANSIYLTSLTSSPVLSQMDFSWHATRGSSLYWFSCSRNTNGANFNGHSFDIGNPTIVLATGTNTVNGLGSFTSRPAPSTIAGETLYFEVAARDAAGVIYDSNVQAVTFY